ADVGLATQTTFDTHFVGETHDLAGEGSELVHHGVDGALEFENFASSVHRDLTSEIAFGYGGRHYGDVAHLQRQRVRHQVYVFGQLSPTTAQFTDRRLTAEFAFGTHFAGNARHLRHERVQAIHHRIDGVLEILHFSARIHRN